MTRFRISLSIGAIAFSLILAAAPAEALNAVSYVSAFTGSSANSCDDPTAPCASIFDALTKTEPGGEIKCLDNHQELFFSINKPITIDCDATAAGLFGFHGTSAIGVNVSETTYPNAVVTLRNLKISGFPGSVGSGANGIRIIGGGGAVHIENCTIQGFAGPGIGFEPTSSVDLFVRDTTISNNAGGGILIKPSGASSAKLALDNLNVEGNANGIFIDARSTSGSIKATVRDSTVAANGAFGIYAADGGGGTTNVTVEGSTSANNTTFGIGSNVNSFVRVGDSTVTGNGTGLQIAGSGKIISLGGNKVRANTANGAFTATEAPQ